MACVFKAYQSCTATGVRAIQRQEHGCVIVRLPAILHPHNTACTLLDERQSTLFQIY